MAEKRFIKGLFKDTGHIDQPEGSWRHAKNMVINKTEGAVSNEGGTQFAGKLGSNPHSLTGEQDYKVIGIIEVDNDRAILFSTDIRTVYDPSSGTAPRSEIGIWENNTYTALFNPIILGGGGNLTNDLNFRQEYPIEGTYKIDPKGDLLVYWTDDNNPPRAFNIDRQIRESLTPTANISQLYGIASNQIDNIDILNLFPYSGPIPHIDIDDQGSHQGCVIEGGGLLTAVYYLALAYVDDDLVATNFLTVSNPISIVDEFDATVPTNKKDGGKEGNQTTKAIKWDISNLNTNYKYLRPVVIRSKGEAREAFKLNDVTFTTNTTNIIFSGLETKATGSVEDVIIDTIAYDTAKTIQQLDNVLYLGNTTRSVDLGYQKYANNIKLKSRVKTIENFDEFYASVDNLQTGWGSKDVNNFGGNMETVDPTKSYRYIPNIFNFKGYTRGEVYAFYIAFILNDGSMSYAYHIPGREALGNELLGLSTLNATQYGRLWADISNVSKSYGKRFHWIDSYVDSINNGSYDINTYMGMNYWENATEFYPETDNYEVWDAHEEDVSGLIADIKGGNVRHHHFPSNRHPDRQSIVDHNCETKESAGTVPPVQPWRGIISKQYNSGNSNIGMGCSWSRTRWSTVANHFPANDPAMEAALWINTPGQQRFVADQPLQIRVRWEVWYHECGNAETVNTRVRHKPAGGGAITTISDDSIGHMGSGGCGGGCDDATIELNWTGWHDLNAGDEVYMEHRCDCSTSGGCAHQTGNHWDDVGCYRNSIPNPLSYLCCISGYCMRCVTYWQIDVKPKTKPVPEDYLYDAKISQDVRALGFDLEDIKIPQSIADKVQGFKIYYAKRKHSDRTVLGQSVLIPAMYKMERLGICSEATTNPDASQVLSALQDLPEPFYNMDPWASNQWDYPELDHFNETGGPTDPVGAATFDRVYDTFSFHDFYLLRSKNSLASATHIDIQYRVQDLVWNGPGIQQDKKMVTELEVPTDDMEPVKIREVWGWDAEQNCYPQEIGSAIFMGCNYQTVAMRTQPRLLGQKAKTYLLGDTIFKGDSLGFGGKLFNEFGESSIAFKLMDMHGLSAHSFRSYPDSDSIGPFNSNVYTDPFHGHIGRPHEGEAILTTWLDNNGDFMHNAFQKSQQALVNLKAFKTDVYKSVDSQELVWTGFEVLGEELDNFTFDENGSMLHYSGAPGTGNTETLTGNGGINNNYEGIFGGDTFICRYGVTTSLKRSNASQSSIPRKAIHYHIVESTDNINFRHTQDDNSFYFPNTTARTLLNDAGQKDFMHFDNLRYNENYSEVNDIRPAFPLPLRDTIQDDFATRVHRSAQHDTTSIIDNYRVFLANQFRDLPKHRGDLWKLASFSNTLYFHMEESLYSAQGKQTMQMGDGSEAFIGSGDIFQQEPNEVIQTEGGFGGTKSQWASLTTRHGYFFVDKPSSKIFLMKDQLLEISNIGMEEWFRNNMTFELEQYGLASSCVGTLDNPVLGIGFHSVYDPKFKRIILTKRDYRPTQQFLDGYNSTTIGGGGTNCQNHPELLIRFNKDTCTFEQWRQKKCGTSPCPCHWVSIPFNCTGPYYKCRGWTISYYPEMGVWGSFHDYVPYIYFNTSKNYYSLTDKYIRPAWSPGIPAISWVGTTYGNAGIWEHNNSTEYGILYQENVTNQYSEEEYEAVQDHNPFEFEFIHNEYKGEDTLVSAINYTLETFNQAGISVLEHGFTSFFVYNTFQLSGIGQDWLDLNENPQQDSNGITLTAANINALEYFINIRRVGNNWKINHFRDMAALAVNTNAYYMSTNVNVIGGTNVGTITSSDTQNMFIIDGMTKIVNAAYLNLDKNWNLQRKFMDKWVGIRLIYNNVSNNLLNLYSTDVGVRKVIR